jgi:hypothetical protein
MRCLVTPLHSCNRKQVRHIPERICHASKFRYLADFRVVKVTEKEAIDRWSTGGPAVETVLKQCNGAF